MSLGCCRCLLFVCDCCCLCFDYCGLWWYVIEGVSFLMVYVVVIRCFCLLIVDCCGRFVLVVVAWLLLVLYLRWCLLFDVHRGCCWWCVVCCVWLVVVVVLCCWLFVVVVRCRVLFPWLLVFLFF